MTAEFARGALLGAAKNPSTTKKPLGGAAFRNTAKTGLLDLCFFVRNVLACFGIELHDLHFRRRGTLVFGRCVEMTRTGSRF